MKARLRAAGLGLLVLAMMGGLYARAQAAPTATQGLQLSAFGGVTGNFTGLQGGKNLGISAGADLSFHRFFSLTPSLEVRGMYPLDKGTIDSQKNALIGLKVAKDYGRFHPYGDLLFGRGAINFSKPYPDATGTVSYLRTTSNVYSPGVGVDFDLTGHLAFKADVQFQRYATPVTASGSLYAKPITFGAVYRFDFNRHGHDKDRRGW
jgi:hypothetical protein